MNETEVTSGDGVFRLRLEGIPTLRELYAGMAMQILLSAKHTEILDISSIANLSVRYADALVEKLANERTR